MPIKSKSKDPMEAVLANIEKSMGSKSKSPFARFGSIEKDDIAVIPFGIAAVDDASYCGGIPRGKMVEIFGPESGGKSLLSLHLIASAQKQGLNCALLDIEQSFDPNWASKYGVDVDKLVYSNEFSCGENALEYAYRLCSSGAFGLVVIDSTAALTPMSELEGNLTDNAVIGEQARMMSRGCRKIVDACGKGDTTCVFINQIRMKIGVMYGNPETTPGGQALRFYSHQRIRVHGSSKIKVKVGGIDIIVGQISKVTFVKNKVARPFGQCEFKIVFDQTALNPVVMLCNTLRTAKLIKPYKGVFRLTEDCFGEVIETGATSIVELADYIVREKKVIPLIEKLLEVNKEDPLEEEIDASILEMQSDPTKIVSPKDSSAVSDTVIDAKKIADANSDDVVASEEKEDFKEE